MTRAAGKQVVGVKTKKLSNGTTLRIYFVKKGKKSRGTKSTGKENAGKAPGKGRGT